MSKSVSLRILLVGNFEPDRQQSMLHFERMMAAGLAARGHQVETISPRPVLARLARPYRYAGWPKWLGYADKFLVFPRLLRRRARAFRPDVVHIVDHANAVYADAVEGWPLVCTCHDLLQIRAASGEFPQHRPGGLGVRFQRWILRHIRGLDHVVCVSQQTRVDLARLAGLPAEKIAVIPNGLNHPYRRRAAGEAGAALRALAVRNGLPDGIWTESPGFLLNVGGGQWYKNRGGLLEIYAGVRAGLDRPPLLLLAGKPLSEEHRQRVEALGLAEHVKELGPVSVDELEGLYSLAEGLLFPSWAEGFGWPLAEAQACGCAVFTSNRPPMTEVGGEAAVYFDPANPEAAARAIVGAWPGRRRAGEAGFLQAGAWSGELMMQRYETLYREICGEVPATR